VEGTLPISEEEVERMWWPGKSNGRREKIPIGPLSDNPMGLIDTIREYCVEELDSLFFYLPMPKRDMDRQAWAWFEGMRMVGAVRAGPYHLRVEGRPDWMRTSNPILFVDDPSRFLVYRIDRERLSALFA